MQIVLPELGLIFWQLVVFLGLLFILTKYAWKPITGMLKEREEGIEKALKAAEAAKEEMAKLQAANEQLLIEARKEREKMLADAQNTANQIIAEAKEKATIQANQIVAQAHASIEREKAAALADIKNQAAMLSLQIAEKILRKELANKKEQEALATSFLQDIKLN